MKTHIRILGIDDSSFDFKDGTATIVGVVMRLPNYVEGVLVSEVEVDGLDATEKLVKMVNNSRYKKQLKLIFIDGIALGGFNVVDIQAVLEQTGLPVATVTRDMPDFAEIEAALKKHFDDWQARLDIMTRREIREVELDEGPAFVDCVGMDFDDMAEILKASIVRGILPEPVRLAHLIGTAMKKGESRGRA